MENKTNNKFFYILTFFNNSQNKQTFSSVFFLIYMIGIFVNCSIITVICSDHQLHTPMYLFLCNLALADICFTSTTVPNLLYMLYSGDNTMSFIQCFTQMYYVVLAAFMENMILSAMAYDRYVAICNPLNYHHILSWRKCTLLMIGISVVSCLNSVIFIYSASFMSFCQSNTIQQLFCDAKALVKISCGGSEVFYTVFGIQAFLLGLGPFLCSLMSYIKIIKIILGIKSNSGYKKALSTCSSHLTVILMYYTAAFTIYMIPPSSHTDVLEQISTVLYTAIAPMLNPLIYSLRNTDVRMAIKRFVQVDQFKMNSGKI